MSARRRASGGSGLGDSGTSPLQRCCLSALWRAGHAPLQDCGSATRYSRPAGSACMSQTRSARPAFGMRRWITGAAGRGHDHQPPGLAAFGQGTAQAGRPGRGGGDAGDDRDVDPGGAGGGDFLAGAAKDRRVARFQPHHPLALSRRRDDGGVDPGLRPGLRTHLFADKDADAAGGGKRQHLGGHKTVVEDHIGLPQAVHRAQGQQVSRSAARHRQGRYGRAGG